MGSFYLLFDKLWCGKTQLPALNLVAISSNSQQALMLAQLRLYVAVSVILELGGTFLITAGLFSWQPASILFLGIGLKICGGLSSSYFQNKSGILWTLELQNSLKNLRNHKQEVAAVLADKGCSEAEIQGIQQLPSEIYQSEINSYKRSSVINVGTPIACSAALLMNGELGIGLTVLFLGLISFPLGEYFFKEYAYRQESQLRMGKSAHAESYIRDVYHDHLGLTLKVNALSQVSLLLFGLRFLWNGSGELLAIFFGFIQGLMGLTGTLAFQRSRALALRSNETAAHLMDVISGPMFIITARRWNEHRLQLSHLMECPIDDGVYFYQFSPKFMGLRSLTFGIPSQGACILQAPSGMGKSTFLAAALHLLEHTGGLYFIENGNCKDVHLLERESFEEAIVFLREENMDESARLVDLFREVAKLKLDHLFQDMLCTFGEQKTILAWQVADNLLEKEIEAIKFGRQSVFPVEMIKALIQLRSERSILVNDSCKMAGGNLVSPRIYPERSFSTLSSGEKQRLICLLSYERASSNKKTKLVILDEPLAHLDIQSIGLQIEMIRRIQDLSNPTCLLIISHLYNEQLAQELRHVATVLFNQETGVQDNMDFPSSAAVFSFHSMSKTP